LIINIKRLKLSLVNLEIGILG